MVARSGKLGGAAVRRRRTKTRRRFDIALSVPGAELRLPAIPAVRLGWRVLSGFLVVLLLGLLYTLWNLPAYQVEAARVRGLQRLTAQEVNAVLKVAGKPIFTVEPRRLERDLQEAFPELYDIAVRASFPAEVMVSVQERQPVLAWNQGSLTLWVDEQGVAFPPRGEADIQVLVEGLAAPPSLPASEEQKARFLDPAWIPAIITVAEYAPEGTRLLYDSRHGLGWQDPQGWQVFLGKDNRDIGENMQVYTALKKQLVRDGISPALISVEYVDAPYYRMER